MPGARRDDGAWWMALTCWLCGWAAAGRRGWEPLALAGTAAWLLAAAPELRTARRWLTRRKEGTPSSLLLAAGVLLPVAAALSWFVSRVEDETWQAAIVMPGLLYGGILIGGLERFAVSRALAVVAITSIAPATYGIASGGFGRVALLLWAFLGGYLVLGSFFVMARLRRSARLLWTVRVGSSTIAAGALLCTSQRPAHGLVAAAFGILAVRAWLNRPRTARPEPRRLGVSELGFTLVASALILLAIRP